MLRTAMLALAVASGLPLAAQNFETAKVISQNIESYNRGAAAMPIGTMIVAAPIVRRSNTVVVETGSERLTWSELGNGKHVLVLPVNGAIQFYRDKSAFIVRDASGKKHKFGLLHEELIGAK